VPTSFKVLYVADDDAHAGLGEAVGAHVAPGHGPLVALLGEDGSDEAEDAHDVGSPAELFVETLLGVVAPDLGPVLREEGREGQRSVSASTRNSAVEGNWLSSWSMTRLKWALTWVASGWAKMVRTRVASMAWAAFGPG
jgi:hypothetical protein